MKDWLAFLIFRGIWWVSRLFRLTTVCRVGGWLGGAVRVFFPAYARLAARNMRIALGDTLSEEAISALVRDHFAKLGGNLLAGVRVTEMELDAIMPHLEIRGLDQYETLRAQGKGTIMLVCHMGNWELFAHVAPRVLGLSGTIYQRLGNPHMDALVRRERQRNGLATFERKEGLQDAIRLLRAGGALGILLDQHAGDSGLWCSFFGRLASTSPMASMLAIRTGAAVMTATVYTKAPGQWLIEFTPMPSPPDGVARDIGRLTAWMNRAIESRVRGMPDDWFWEHARWKTPRPNFLLDSYKRGLVVEPGETLKPFRILLRSPNWLGDAVMSIPAARAFKAGRPDAHVTVLAPEKIADLWRAAGVDEVISFSKGESPLAIARRLRAYGFDVAVLFPHSLRSALEVWLAGIPRRVGYPGHVRRHLLNQRLEPKRKKSARMMPPSHHVTRYLELARFCGADLPKKGGSPWTIRPLEKKARYRIGMVPGAEYGAAKRWPADRFAGVAARMHTLHGVEWVLFGVARDKEIADAIRAEAQVPMEDLVGRTTLAELIRELQRCDVVLTNDTGTMHLAVMLGVPVVAIFGSTEPSLTGPPPPHKVLRVHVPCSPCFLRECPLDLRCMNAVTIEAAVSALEETLELPSERLELPAGNAMEQAQH